jgi:hypothetical protein
MGDGNMHFNVSQPPGMDKKMSRYWNEMNKVVFDVVQKLCLHQRAWHRALEKHHAGIKSPVELQMMHDLKLLIPEYQTLARCCLQISFRDIQEKTRKVGHGNTELTTAE